MVLFLEWFPYNLRTWLGEQIAAGKESSRAPLAMVERELLAATSFMGARGMVHFDAHFENILTDGLHLYLSDFGQALWSRFALTPAEIEFLERHRDFDRSYVVTILANFVRDGPCEGLLERYAPIADLLNDFFRRLRTESKATPYPAAELARTWTTFE